MHSIKHMVHIMGLVKEHKDNKTRLKVGTLLVIESVLPALTASVKNGKVKLFHTSNTSFS